MGSNLILHCGARQVTRAELDAASQKTPEPTRTWYPIPHSVVLDRAVETLGDAGFGVQKVQVGLSRGDARMFATIDTATNLNAGSVTLAAAVVNSWDKSPPMKVLAGARCFCCDNLALRSDVMAPVVRKHSRFGLERFREAMSKAIRSLEQFARAERLRIHRFQNTPITDGQAESVLLRAFERGVLSARVLPEAIREWRSPSFEEFAPRTWWSLENVLTGVLHHVQKSNPQRFCALSLAAQGLLSEAAGVRPEEAHEALSA